MGKSKNSVVRDGSFLKFSRHTKPILQTVVLADRMIHVVEDVLKDGGHSVFSSFVELGGSGGFVPGRVYRAGHMKATAEAAIITAKEFKR